MWVVMGYHQLCHTSWAEAWDREERAPPGGSLLGNLALMYTVILVACDTAPRTPPPRPKGPGIEVVENLELEICILSIFFALGIYPAFR